MGKSVWSLCGMFSACFSSSRSSRSGGDDDEGVYIRRRICPSDEDRLRWVAEPGIDRKASAFIARFYENRLSATDP